jgi:chromosome segregation ATPase
VQREAEALTEEWHAAQDTVDARQAELQTLQQAVAPAQAAVDKAKADEEQYRQQLDAVAMGTFESGNLDQFNALLASGSPQDFLDQMSALETLSADYKAALEQLSSVVDVTAKAQSDADAAVERAKTAADEAQKAEDDVAARKRDAEIRIDQAEKLLERLSPQQRRARNGPQEDAPDVPITGTGAGVEALKAAATQLGKPYQWGAARAATTAPVSRAGPSRRQASRSRGRAASRRASARLCRGTTCSPATSSSTTHR